MIILDRIRARVGPLVIGAGMSMVALAYLGYNAPGRPPAAAPRPTVTVQVTPSTSPTAPQPSKTPQSSTPPHPGSAMPVTDRASRRSDTSGGNQAPRPTSAPTGPSPTAQPPRPADCLISARVLVVSARVCTGG